MPTESVIPPQDVTFPIAYEHPGTSSQNSDFKGRGTFTARAAGPMYIFSGQSRSLLSSTALERQFAADEIHNLSVSGPMISFDARRKITGARDGHFVFFCADAAAARTVASLLPATIDADFVAVRDFGTRLRSLKGASSPWTSVTNIIIALNVIVFVIMGALGAGWIEVKSMTPYILYGANQGAATTDGEWWRLLTSMFMHYGLIHLLFNMWALYQAGHFVEKLQGRALYALTYLASGLAGGFASIAWHGDQTWSAGASGAIFGVYGAILGFLLREKQGLPASIYSSLLKSSLLFAVYNIVFSATRAGIDNSAHIGGVVGGIAMGWLVALPVDRAIRDRQTGRRIVMSIIAIVAMIVAGVALTPRFDYSVRDELTLDETNHSFIGQEAALSKQNQAGLEAIERGGDAQAHGEWIASHVVPFYRSWENKLAALTLKPGQQTAIRRDKLQTIIHQQAEANSRLAMGFKNHDPGALARYARDKEAIFRQIEELNKQ
jgi:rhomboid protease GluP